MQHAEIYRCQQGIENCRAWSLFLFLVTWVCGLNVFGLSFNLAKNTKKNCKKLCELGRGSA